ncbi:FimV/HubP family polar landmark protein [Shewanella woodyi]|uniref:Pilus assembly protein FimV n=1 Tax=Shewanella woodyi (strain ATCC 51908 / MS32) TaxID=392500 RepID=B1KKN9_SHEWM|nr:FimV/HubP family polar landmark protein [Shewanella woodyi]ACA87256.1 conserved hypothetical protein [Shewanella woodyi ATCC 51908]
MNFRTPYLVGLIASILLVLVTSSIEQTVSAAEPLKITGPDGEVRETTRQYGPTRSSDTFWSIAQKMQPDASVSIYQVMGAIYDANPHAFTNSNYNSLEKGMILLIPSKEVMLAIPKSMAKQRAERNDAGWKKITAKPVAAQKPSTPVAEPIKTEQPESASVKEPVSESPKSVNDAVQNSDLQAKLDASEDKNLQLADELVRAQDELSLSSSDIEALTGKVDLLNEEVAVLQEQLQASRLKNESLTADVEALKERLAEMELPAPQEDEIKWKELMSNPVALILGAALPAFIFLILLWLFLKRRRNEGEQQESEEKSVEGEAESAPAPSAEEAVSESETSDDMAVHLDTEEDEDSLDSLMNVDSSELQPEVEMEVDSEQMDMANEMFVDPGETETEGESDLDVEDEGQSLDELWAEAMGEQDGEGEEDLDSLLEDFGVDEKEETPDAAEADLDSLLTDINETETASEPESAEQEEDLDALLEGIGETEAEPEVKSEEADLDSLLEEFDLPAEESQGEESGEDLNEAIAAELAAEADNEQVDEADLDSLLAGFDEPQGDETPEEAELSEEIAAQLAADTEDEPVDEADLDSLLAGFDEPENAENSESAEATEAPELTEEADLSAEIAAELTESVDEQADEADLDSLLAGFDEPENAENSESAEATEAPELTEEADLSAEIAAELTESVDEQADEADLDSLLAGFDEPENAENSESAEATEAPELTEEADLSAEIAAELTESVDEQAVDADLDSLLAGFYEPENAENSESVEAPELTEEADLSAEIAAELTESVDEQADDADLDSLLAGFDEPENAENSESVETPELTEEADLGEEIAAELTESVDEPKSTENLESTESVEATELPELAEEADLGEELAAQKSEVEAEDTIDDADLDSLLDGFDEPAEPLQSEDVQVEEQVEPQKDEALDALLADLKSVEEKPASKEDNFFGDLKSNKSKSDNSLEWDGALTDDANESQPAEGGEHPDVIEEQSDDDFDLSLADEGKITVDEALAALDAQEQSESSASHVDEHDLTTFQKDNGFIDIDRLLNEADEESDEVDQYKELDVDMGELDSLMGNASMVDVDDEENSVNAKLDLARAYIEIDDNDSAMALLKEVQLDGNERQQEEAQGLIKTLG